MAVSRVPKVTVTSKRPTRTGWVVSRNPNSHLAHSRSFQFCSPAHGTIWQPKATNTGNMGISGHNWEGGPAPWPSGKLVPGTFQTSGLMPSSLILTNRLWLVPVELVWGTVPAAVGPVSLCPGWTPLGPLLTSFHQAPVQMALYRVVGPELLFGLSFCFFVLYPVRYSGLTPDLHSGLALWGSRTLMICVG